MSTQNQFVEFETTAIYSVIPEIRTVVDREGSIVPVSTTEFGPNLFRPFFAKGLTPQDLAVFGTAIDEQGAEAHSFLVINHGGDSSKLAPAELVLQEQRLITRHLAVQLASVPIAELVQFSSDTVDMEKLVDLSQKRHFKSRG